MKRVALHTLGCKLNFAETSTLGRQFLDRGFELVQSTKPADVYVLNTCSVTERADREARQWIRRFLRTSPNAFVIVTGCYAQLEPEEIASIDGVDVVLGSQEKFHLFDLVQNFSKTNYPRVFVSDIRTASSDVGPAFSADVGGRTRAFLKVQDGCDYTCAFCTIPLARGQSRSLPIDVVVSQARLLRERGFKEIVLTGVNVGDYGRRDGVSLLQLLRALDDVDGIERIRISSLEPNLLTPRLIEYILETDKYCNHFHIPLQSGSNAVLKKMRRRYLTENYRAVVEYIKERDETAGIGADVIIGFPGETDKLFEESYRFLVDLPVSYLHVFTYSERPNTPAAAFEGSVEPRIRSQRSALLRNLSAKKRHAFYQQFIGATLDVLCESTNDDGWLSGFSTNYIRVRFPANAVVANTIVPVTLKNIEGNECFGELFDPELPTKSKAPRYETVSHAHGTLSVCC